MKTNFPALQKALETKIYDTNDFNAESANDFVKRMLRESPVISREQACLILSYLRHCDEETLQKVNERFCLI